MSDTKIQERLSALMDGALDGDAARFALRAAAGCSESRAWWARQHLASDLLRRRHSLPASPAFAERVAAALGEPAVQPRRRGRWLRVAGGGAIAASVALVALILAQPAGEVSVGPAPAPVAESPVAAADPAVERRMIAQRGPALAAAQPASAVLRPQLIAPLPATAALRVPVDPHWTMVRAPLPPPEPVEPDAADRD